MVSYFKNKRYASILAIFQTDISRIRHSCGSAQKGTKRPTEGCPVFLQVTTSSFKHVVQTRLRLRFASTFFLKLVIDSIGRMTTLGKSKDLSLTIMLS